MCLITNLIGHIPQKKYLKKIIRIQDTAPSLHVIYKVMMNHALKIRDKMVFLKI